MNFIHRPWFPIVLVSLGLSACAHLDELDSTSSQNLDAEPRFNEGRATGGSPSAPSPPSPGTTATTTPSAPSTPDGAAAQQTTPSQPSDPRDELKNINPDANDEAPVNDTADTTGDMADAGDEAAPAAEPEELPYGIPVPGRPGTVYSPYDRTAGFVDVSGLAPGTVVTDPYTGNQFRVP